MSSKRFVSCLEKKDNVLSVNQSAALKTSCHFFKNTFQAQKTF